MVSFRLSLLFFAALMSVACESPSTQDPLTLAERTWLQEHSGKIRLAPTPNYPPIDFFDATGAHRGVAAEHIRLIEARLNFRFKRVQLESWNDILSKAQSREIDVTSIAQKTEARSKYLRFTKPYLTVPTVIIARNDRESALKLEEMAGMTIAVVKGYAVVETVLKNYPDLKLVLVPNDEAGIMKVSFGQVDAMLADLAVAVEYIDNKGISNLRVAGKTGHEYKYSIATRSDLPMLNGILEKGLSLITEDERAEIRRRWIHLGDGVPYYKTRDFWTTLITVLSVFIILISLSWNRSLRRVVKIRTAELERELTAKNVYEKELKEAKAAAVFANKAKTAFLSDMSHEIRTPLNAILGMTSLLMTTGLNAEQARFSQVISQAGDTLLTLINNILDLSKIEAGEMKLDEVDFSIQECLLKSLDIVSPIAIEKNNTLHLRIEELPCSRAYGDSHRLQQVLVNLLSNALKFTVEGKVELIARGRDCENGESFELELAIVDEGEGLTEEAIQRVFQSFQQAESGTSREYGGSGLGLPICVKLLKLMGGSVSVQSPGKGQGSTFTARLPLRRGSAASKLPESAWVDHLPGKQVFILDSDHSRSLELQESLDDGRMNVSCFDSLEKLEGALEGGVEPDLVILDVSADEALIEKLISLGRVSIFQIATRGQSLDFLDSRRRFDAVIVEPFDPDFLLRTAVENLGSGEEKLNDPADESQGKFKERRERILVVDDNTINQEVAVSLLRNLHYLADVAGSGSEALKKCIEDRYDIVLMDIQMEGMDGVETTRKIRETVPENEQPWIIALTANALGDQREHYLAEGMDDYLSKPFRSVDLLRVIEAAERSPTLERESVQVVQSQANPVEWQTLQGLYECMGDDALESFARLIESFYDDMEDVLAKIDESDNPKARAQLAHRLFGSSMSLGVHCVGIVSKELEQCESSDEVKLNELYERLRGACVEAKELLRDWPEHIR